MCMVCDSVYVASAAVLVATSSVDSGSGYAASLASLQEAPAAIKEVSMPEIQKPDWYVSQVKQDEAIAAESGRRANPGAGGGRVVTYSVSTKGSTSSDLAEFSSQVNQTLNDSRGWSQLGISFQEVSTGGSFNLILSEASQVPSFSSGCSSEWSCRVGVSVIINDMRWIGATDPWNAAGGSIRDYRHMVVNHEVGHWLGHGHLGCSGPGEIAPVMQQQSMGLQGCKFNPWPLAGELWSSQLGV